MNIENWYNSVVEFDRERFSQYIRDRFYKWRGSTDRKVKIPAGHPRARAGVGQDQVGRLCAASRLQACTTSGAALP